MYVHIFKIVFSHSIALKNILLYIVKKQNKTLFHRRGTAILRNEEKMKNFTCSGNDSIYILFHFQRNRNIGRIAFRMKHEEQNCSIGGLDRIVISIIIIIIF